VRSFTITCGTCEHSWNLDGYWSEYERQEIESRPCPCCGSYTLKSPEPKPKASRSRTLFWTARQASEVRVGG